VNFPSSSEQDGDRGERNWEIYEIGATTPYAWSWRYRVAGEIARRGDIMYSTMGEAIDDANAHGMDDPRSRCDIVRADATRVRYKDGASPLEGK
jgi:hypothetical protein